MPGNGNPLPAWLASNASAFGSAPISNTRHDVLRPAHDKQHYRFRLRVTLPPPPPAASYPCTVSAALAEVTLFATLATRFAPLAFFVARPLVPPLCCEFVVEATSFVAERSGSDGGGEEALRFLAFELVTAGASVVAFELEGGGDGGAIV